MDLNWGINWREVEASLFLTYCLKIWFAGHVERIVVVGDSYEIDIKQAVFEVADWIHLAHVGGLV